MWRYLLLLFILPATLYGQKTDSAYIQPFARKNMVELYGGTYNTNLSLTVGYRFAHLPKKILGIL